MGEGKLTAAQMRAWTKRAKTLHAKAEELMSQAITALGTDDPLTDEVDNILVATADTVDHLLRRAALTKGPSNG